MADVELGLGLLSIGRLWGVRGVRPPSAKDACRLVETAYREGIRFFDTAPSYAGSEAVLGRALAGDVLNREEITIATKMGEHWDAAADAARVGHAYDELAASLDRSIALLGRIDILQLHKATPETVAARDVVRAFDRATSLGITRFGASVSDLATAEAACRSGLYEFLQFPYNIATRYLETVFGLLRDHRMKAIVNRPFAMGALVDGEQKATAEDLFRFILDTDFSGVILTGTSSPTHLADNIAAFRRATA